MRVGSHPVSWSPVAQSPTGKAVSKVASTGGGRTYRAQRPNTYYAVLVVIVVLGLASVVAARSSYKNGAVTTTSAASLPQAGTTTYAALAFDFCGVLQPTLPAAPVALSSIQVIGNGVIKIAPKDATTAGSNSTMALVAKGYPGLKLSATSVSYPSNAISNASVTYKNGETCPAGTPDAGKTAQVGAALWSSFVSKTPVINANPASAHVQGSSLITVSFVPSGATVLRPSQASITQMLKENAGSVATTTTSTSTSTTSTTTSPSTTTTTMARTSTTTKQG